jgi:hypothetical protein
MTIDLDRWVKAWMGQIETSPLVGTLNLCWDLGLEIFPFLLYIYILHVKFPYIKISYDTHFFIFFLFYVALHNDRQILLVIFVW